MSITLTSSDEVSFEVDRQALKHAGTIEDLITNMGLDDADTPAMPIPLPNVNGRILEMVIDWLKAHKDDPVTVKDDGAEKRIDDVPQWDKEFIGAVNQSTLFELVLAANYLDIKVLLDYTCKSIAGMIKGKTTEQMRAQFNIVNDFTPDEEEQIRKENAWAEE